MQPHRNGPAPFVKLSAPATPVERSEHVCRIAGKVGGAEQLRVMHHFVCLAAWDRWPRAAALRGAKLLSRCPVASVGPVAKYLQAVFDRERAGALRAAEIIQARGAIEESGKGLLRLAVMPAPPQRPGRIKI